MRTFVLLAALLLATSATPIENSFPGTSVEHTVETDQERGPPSLPGDASSSASDVSNQDEMVQDDNTGDEVYNGDITVTSVSTVSASTEPEDQPVEDGDHAGGENNNADTNNTSASTVSPSTQPEEPEQATNSSIGPPADADPDDCRNASKPNHVYLLCSYSCEGDEMFMAVNNSRCYLNPPNLTAKYPISVMYNSKEHHDNNTGVCVEGECVGKPTEDTSGPTESSPTQSSAVNTDRETENTGHDQASVVTAQPSDVIQSVPQRPQPEGTPTQNNTPPEKPVLNNAQNEGKEATPQVPSSFP